MNNLKTELLNVDKFELLARKLISKKIIDIAKEYIDNLKTPIPINPREFLSAFMIYKFPEDSIGSYEIENNKNVIDLAKSLIDSKEENITKLIIKFCYNFKIWKEEDLIIIKQQLFNEYHQLSVDIIDTDNEDKKIIFETVKEEILKCARNVGGNEFIQEIQNYTPIVMDLDQLKNQYDKAYFDLLSEEFNNKNYEKLENLLNFINGTLRQLNNVSEINKINELLDVEYIIQRFKINSFKNNELKEVCNYMYDLVRNIQSASYDNLISEYKSQLENEIYFPNVVMNVMKLIRNIIHDLENLKDKYQQK